MENKNDIQYLLKKFRDGSLSKEEKALLENWVLFGDFSERELLDDEIDSELEKVSSRLPLIQVRSIRLWPRVAAAAIILIIGAGLLYYNISKDHKSAIQYSNDVPPGKNTATLILASGKKLVLSDAANGEIAKESGVVISKDLNGQLTYEIKSSAQTKAEHPFNTLTTARGETYKVRLPDGTLIQLNAESSIKYPASFAGLSKRSIELTGEAYFEVAKDKIHPFSVKTNNQEVEVLGTHFNINSYTNESAIKTTLIEGSVRVTLLQDVPSRPYNSIILKPNQQSSLSGTKLNVENIDTELAVAWKDNNFIFDNSDIKSVMRVIERWYNVEVIYAGSIPVKKFGGAVSRFDNISSVLRILESTGGAHFRVEGRKVYVFQ